MKTRAASNCLAAGVSLRSWHSPDYFFIPPLSHQWSQCCKIWKNSSMVLLFYLTLSKSSATQINHQINATFFFLTFHIEKQSMCYYSSLPSTEQLLQTSEKHCTAQKLFLENKSPKWHDHINQICKIFFKLYQSWRLSIPSKIPQVSHYI